MLRRVVGSRNGIVTGAVIVSKCKAWEDIFITLVVGKQQRTGVLDLNQRKKCVKPGVPFRNMTLLFSPS